MSDVQKRALLSGWCEETVNTRLDNLRKIPHAGDWRRSKVIRVQVKTATITWLCIPTDDVFTITSPEPTGMGDLFEKLQSAQNRTFVSLPNSVKEYFDLTKETYKPTEFRHTVTFSGLSFLFELRDEESFTFVRGHG